MSHPAMDLRKGSRLNWTSNTGNLNVKQIQAGALLRIADATEKMCLDREKLERDYHYMRQSRDRYRDLYEKERRRNAGLRGYMNRLKKLIAHFEELSQ